MSFFSIILGDYSNQGEILYKFIRSVLELNYDQEDLGELVDEMAFAYMCKDYLFMTKQIEWIDNFDLLLEHERIILNKKQLQEEVIPIVAAHNIDFGDGIWEIIQFSQYLIKKEMLEFFENEMIALKVMDSLLFIDRYSDYPIRNQILSPNQFFGKYKNRFEHRD